MVTDDLKVSICACALMGFFAASAFGQATKSADTVAETLAVQIAMQQARNHLLAKRPAEAVAALEKHIAHIDGNRYYLLLLRDAYRAYLRELTLNNQHDQARVYLARLKILDPDTKMALPAATATAAATRTNPKPIAVAPASTQPASAVPMSQPKPVALTTPTSSQPPAPSTSPPTATEADPLAPTYRGKGPDEKDPFQQEPANLLAARKYLEGADKEFAARRYVEAGTLYEKAFAQTSNLPDASRERWAYCKLHQVVEQLNSATTPEPAYPRLEQEVRRAMQLAPRIQYAQTILTEIERRRKRKPSDVILVRHKGQGPDGWQVAETDNFRVFHNQTREYAEQAARAAERTRTRMQNKWFGAVGPSWRQKCSIYLHATGEDYSKATGAPAGSPGHSSFQLESGRVLGRQIDLHCDHPNLVIAVLPHETTHTVLAGNFGTKQLPRWADEGMAVLTEPEEQIAKHRRKLPGHRRAGNLYTLQHLIELGDYPEGKDPEKLRIDVDVFYAQSVSVVEFMTQLKGPRVLTECIRDGMRQGFEPAIQKHYGFRSYLELQEEWLEYAFPKR